MKIVVKLNETKRVQLEQAERELSLAGHRIYESARQVEPFRASKYLNVLGKIVSQLRVELAIFLGEYDTNIDDMEETGYSLPSTKLLNIMKKDGELKEEEKI